MEVRTERSLPQQLATARFLLAQFRVQLDEYKAMSKGQRMSPRGLEISARLSGLAAGEKKWAARVSVLERRIAAGEK